MTSAGIDPRALRPDTVHEIAAGRVLRTYGPPGTGKTTTLAGELRQLVAARGQRAAAVVSFTTTAAAEIAGRNTGLASSAVGTLHSLGRRMVGADQEVALDPKIIADWNRDHGDAWSVTPDGRRGAPDTAADAGLTGGSSGDQGGDLESGDALLSAMDYYRATLTPRESWRPQVAEFADAWEQWKQGNDLQDYCLDEQTEVLTSRGWLTGEQVREGDLVRAIDPDTGLAEWAPVESVYRRRGRCDMIHMRSAVHDSMTTPDHRWLTNRRNSRQEWHREWVTTAALNSTCRIPRAAISGDAPTDPKYVDAFVELVAWWFTEGSYATRARGGQIGQSHRVNPTHCARIEAAIRALAGPPGVQRNGRVTWSLARSERRGMTFYGLGGDLVDELAGVAPDKVPSVEFLAQLTAAQLRMFVDTALDADGHVRAQASVFRQLDPRRTEAMATAAVLAGRAVTFAERGEHLEVTISARRLHAVVPGTTTGHATGTRTRVVYDGLIWCPTVAGHHNFLARRNGRTFYTGNSDMISGALERALEGEPPPDDPPFLIVDEAQDLTPAEAALVFALGRTRERLVLALDDDQAIMEWRGGDAGPILDLDTRSGPTGDLEVTDRVLEQSYRIPASVHACAAQLADQLTRRRPKVYRPRDERGAIRRLPITVADHRLANRIARDVDAGRTVMVLAPCTYMLTPLIGHLRAAGVPYANAFRPAESRWNPLRPPGEGKWSPALRMLAASVVVDPAGPRAWTGRDLRAFTEMMAVGEGGLKRNAKARIKLLPDGEVPWSEIEALFEVEALDGLIGPEPEPGAPAPDPLTVREQLQYLIGHTTKTWEKRLEYPARVLDRFGPGPLHSTGRLEPLDEGGVPVCIGTVHSVKGGGADVVYVCPELSSAGFRQLGRGGGQRDQILRLFYVALTRAKEEVCVLDSASGSLFPRTQLVPPPLEVQP